MNEIKLIYKHFKGYLHLVEDIATNMKQGKSMLHIENYMEICKLIISNFINLLNTLYVL